MGMTFRERIASQMGILTNARAATSGEAGEATSAAGLRATSRAMVRHKATPTGRRCAKFRRVGRMGRETHLVAVGRDAVGPSSSRVDFDRCAAADGWSRDWVAVAQRVGEEVGPAELDGERAQFDACSPASRPLTIGISRTAPGRHVFQDLGRGRPDRIIVRPRSGRRRGSLIMRSMSATSSQSSCRAIGQERQRRLHEGGGRAQSGCAGQHLGALMDRAAQQDAHGLERGRS